MNMYDIIYKKRQGEALGKDEIRFFIEGYTKGSIPDYQASALLMAIYFQKMNTEETYLLTDAMRHSGDVVDLSSIKGVKVDKHSTGGVGDKTTLIVGPLAAACGVPIAKMSGRGLGFTGGTVDKMESIPGFKTTLSEEEFLDLVNRIGISVIGQTGQIAPADKKLYALRDVTATVDNISLITSSIMSKKLAAGSDAIVLDVKCGKGAFVETIEAAEELAHNMVNIGNADGKKTIALITDMDQPLGNAVGNSLEVIEAIETLRGNGPDDITELSLTLAGYMVFCGGKADTPEEGRALVEKALTSGAALEKMKEFVAGQGGDQGVLEDYSLFPQPSYSQEIFSKDEGFVTSIDARRIGLASQHAGAGRERKEDDIDLSAGLLLSKKVGDKVKPGMLLATVFGNDPDRVKKAAEEAYGAFGISAEKPQMRPLIIKVIQ
ncbi:MAG: pyrimidine-nucleoside phosphorylase [Clostridiales bacterium]|nr:pyrimidine-nucleoside phosphorylase [Clostridiales bacterium]